MASLVYKQALQTGATAFMTDLDTLLTNTFSATNPRGAGWSRVFNSDAGHSATLNANINAVITTIIVDDTSLFQVPGTILIDSEQISYSGVTPTSFTGCLRGINGTVATTHLSSTVIVSVTDKMYFSLGTGGSERILLRFTVSSDDTYIDRQICSVARLSDGYMLNAIGGDSQTRIMLGLAQFEYWIVINQDFMHLVTLIGSSYSHFYCGIINRFAPNQNSSIYGQNAPIPANTTVPSPSTFTVATNTTLFLRTGFDVYGGYGANNLSFITGQLLCIIDQSLGTTTTGNHGVVVLNSVNVVQNTINVSYISGANKFSSFALIGVDPQPNTLNTGGTVRGNPFLMLDDFVGDLTPSFNAVDEFTSAVGLPAESLQNPNIRGVFLTYPIRIDNTQEVRGTLWGLIDAPLGMPGAQDLFRTFDNVYQFIIFPDGSLMIAMGSIV
jgi:hypothetical protein